jgi:hypothetical protein
MLEHNLFDNLLFPEKTKTKDHVAYFIFVMEN